VDQITFSGPQGLVRGQEVLYLTERASFRLTADGIELFEFASGIDLQRDLLDQMAFTLRVAKDLRVMGAEFFSTGCRRVTDPDRRYSVHAIQAADLVCFRQPFRGSRCHTVHSEESDRPYSHGSLFAIGEVKVTS